MILSQPAPPRPYIGRFAPSPTGALHQGSLVAALGSWLDARAHDGRWLVRIEDLDPPREVPGAADGILRTLSRLGLESDGPVMYQSRRASAYQEAFDRLRAMDLLYPCGCTRSDIAAVWQARGIAWPRHRELPYPGTCRDGLAPGRAARAWRARIDARELRWHDRLLGEQIEDPRAQAGDFVLRRADGLWAYQLAVVVDDAAQGITDVVRGTDLADSTARQCILQEWLGHPRPRYLHLPLVLGTDGQKLSKQNGAEPLDTGDPLAALNDALASLGQPAIEANSVPRLLDAAIGQWRRRWDQKMLSCTKI